jgi:hypothetical protein
MDRTDLPMGRRGWAVGGWDGSMFCTEPFSSRPKTPKDTLYQSPGASQWPLGNGCLGLFRCPPQLVLAGPVRPQVAVGVLGTNALCAPIRMGWELDLTWEPGVPVRASKEPCWMYK